MFAGDFYTIAKRTLQVIMVYIWNEHSEHIKYSGDPHLYNGHTEPFNWALFRVSCKLSLQYNIIPLLAIFDVINLITIVNNIDKR